MRGNVTDLPWGLTLGALAARRATGTIAVHADGRRYELSLVNGVIVAATSPLGADAAAAHRDDESLRVVDAGRGDHAARDPRAESRRDRRGGDDGAPIARTGGAAAQARALPNVPRARSRSTPGEYTVDDQVDRPARRLRDRSTRRDLSGCAHVSLGAPARRSCFDFRDVLRACRSRRASTSSASTTSPTTSNLRGARDAAHRHRAARARGVSPRDRSARGALGHLRADLVRRDRAAQAQHVPTRRRASRRCRTMTPPPSARTSTSSGGIARAALGYVLVAGGCRCCRAPRARPACRVRRPRPASPACADLARRDRRAPAHRPRRASRACRRRPRSASRGPPRSPTSPGVPVRPNTSTSPGIAVLRVEHAAGDADRAAHGDRHTDAGVRANPDTAHGLADRGAHDQRHADRRRGAARHRCRCAPIGRRRQAGRRARCVSPRRDGAAPRSARRRDHRADARARSRSRRGRLRRAAHVGAILLRSHPTSPRSPPTRAAPSSAPSCARARNRSRRASTSAASSACSAAIARRSATSAKCWSCNRVMPRRRARCACSKRASAVAPAARRNRHDGARA